MPKYPDSLDGGLSSMENKGISSPKGMNDWLGVVSKAVNVFEQVMKTRKQNTDGAVGQIENKAQKLADQQTQAIPSPKLQRSYDGVGAMKDLKKMLDDLDEKLTIKEAKKMLKSFEESGALKTTVETFLSTYSKAELVY